MKERRPKGNTFLNFYNLDASVIDFVTDASPARQDKLTPSLDRSSTTRSEACGAVRRNTVLELSGALRARLKQLNPHITFLNPYEESA